jgi:putative addiction module component (TIGR02574 family)
MSNHPLLKFEISQLSVAERIQLAEDLWDSILDKTDEIQLNEAQGTATRTRSQTTTTSTRS